MPAIHKIDRDAHTITTTWTGDATDSELYDAFTKYHNDIKSKPEYYSYSEIVDFSETKEYKLTPGGLRNLVELTSSKDIHTVKSKLAIVVNLPLAYGLAKMYEIYRKTRPNSTKELRIFKDYNDAHDWIVN